METTTLKISNISFDATEQDLIDAFDSCGVVVSLRILDIKVKNGYDENDEQIFRDKRVGYVTFMTDKECKLAYHGLNGLNVRGRSIFVDYSFDYKANNVLFVSGLDKTHTADSLKSHFQKFGAVSSVEVNVDSRTQTPNFAFVTFAKLVDATKACHAFSNDKLGETTKVSYARKEQREQKSQNRRGNRDRTDQDRRQKRNGQNRQTRD